MNFSHSTMHLICTTGRRFEFQFMGWDNGREFYFIDLHRCPSMKQFIMRHKDTIFKRYEGDVGSTDTEYCFCFTSFFHMCLCIYPLVWRCMVTLAICYMCVRMISARPKSRRNNGSALILAEELTRNENPFQTPRQNNKFLWCRVWGERLKLECAGCIIN